MIVVIDCGISNLHSIAKALEIVGGDVRISNKKRDIENASKIVLPGVGAFGKAMAGLKNLDLIDPLNKEVLEKGKPYLGICLGMQVLAKEGTEYGINQGLGWINASVKLLSFKNDDLRIPHMGWDDIYIKSDSSLLVGLDRVSTFYFVHSYYMDCQNRDIIVAECDYGGRFPAAILQNNIFAVQFHPEKSQKVGLRLLENFINWKN